MTIREATEKDLEGIYDLMDICMIEPLDEDTRGKIEEALREDISLVVEDEEEEKIVAYSRAVIHEEDSKKICQVESIDIHPNHYGEGIGKEMVKEVRERVKDSGVSLLSIKDSPRWD